MSQIEKEEITPSSDRKELLSEDRLISWGRYAVLAAFSALALHVFAALFAERQLFSDGVWYVLNIASKQGLAYWFQDWWHEFYRSRIGGYIFLQAPAILAIKLGVRSLPAIAFIFGLTMFLHAPLSVYLGMRYARDRAQSLVPLICLFAGSMNVAVFIVVESHFMVSMYVIALCILLFSEEIRGTTLLLLWGVSLPLLLCYESMLFFGVILTGICLWRYRKAAAQSNSLLIFGSLALWYLLGVVCAALGILYPHDPGNRSGFLSSLLFMFQNDHLPARVSVVALLAIVAIVSLPKRFRAVVMTSFGIASVSILYLLFRVLTGAEPHSLLEQNAARTINLTVPLIATALAIGFRSGRLKPERAHVAAAWVIIGMLGFAQAAWSVGASIQWGGIMATLRHELALNTGPIPYTSSVMSKMHFGRLPLGFMHCDWPLLPLSVYASEGGEVKSVVLPPKGRFLPFDPKNPDDFPRLEQFGIRYDKYIESLKKQSYYDLGDLIELRLDKIGLRYLASGWSHPENWATWSEGQEAKLEFDVNPGSQKSDVMLELTLATNVSPQQPRLSTEVMVNDVSVAQWTFNYRKAGEILRQRVRIPQEVYWKNKRLSVLFKLKENVKSPSELGQGNDPRKIGLALIDLRMSRPE